MQKGLGLPKGLDAKGFRAAKGFRCKRVLGF